MNPELGASSNWMERLDRVDVDPEDIRMMIFEYLESCNMTNVAEVFLNESGLSIMPNSSPYMRMLSLFEKELYAGNYANVLSLLDSLCEQGRTAGAFLETIFHVRLCEVSRLLEIEDTTDDTVIEYIKIHLKAVQELHSEDLSQKIDHVLEILLHSDICQRITAAKSLKETLQATVLEMLKKLLSDHFQVSKDPRLIFLLKNLAYSQDELLNDSVPLLDPETFQDFINLPEAARSFSVTPLTEIAMREV